MLVFLPGKQDQARVSRCFGFGKRSRYHEFRIYGCAREYCDRHSRVPDQVLGWGASLRVS